jgi:hypothetical protein
MCVAGSAGTCCGGRKAVRDLWRNGLSRGRREWGRAPPKASTCACLQHLKLPCTGQLPPQGPCNKVLPVKRSSVLETRYT